MSEMLYGSLTDRQLERWRNYTTRTMRRWARRVERRARRSRRRGGDEPELVSGMWTVPWAEYPRPDLGRTLVVVDVSGDNEPLRSALPDRLLQLFRLDGVPENWFNPPRP